MKSRNSQYIHKYQCKNRIKTDYIAWLERYQWSQFVVCTLRPKIGLRTAQRLLRQWIAELEAAEKHSISWFRTVERGADDTLHFHVALAGIRSRFHTGRYKERWDRLAGHCVAVRWDRQRKGVEYMLKSFTGDGDHDFDAHLHDRHLLPRFKQALRLQPSAA